MHRNNASIIHLTQSSRAVIFQLFEFQFGGIYVIRRSNQTGIQR